MKINKDTAEFLREVLFRYKQYAETHRLNTGTHPKLPANAEKQLNLTKEVLSRYSKFGDKADVLKMEQLQVMQFANWLVQAWHDLHGSEKSPQMQFTESGAGWMSEGQV